MPPGKRAGPCGHRPLPLPRIGDELYLFVWREKVIPTLGVVLVDWARSAPTASSSATRPATSARSPTRPSPRWPRSSTSPRTTEAGGGDRRPDEGTPRGCQPELPALRSCLIHLHYRRREYWPKWPTTGHLRRAARAPTAGGRKEPVAETTVSTRSSPAAGPPEGALERSAGAFTRAQGSSGRAPREAPAAILSSKRDFAYIFQGGQIPCRGKSCSSSWRSRSCSVRPSSPRAVATQGPPGRATSRRRLLPPPPASRSRSASTRASAGSWRWMPSSPSTASRWRWKRSATSGWAGLSSTSRRTTHPTPSRPWTRRASSWRATRSR